ncbi:MAG: hypothetical protein V1790_13685 [Planctomycetota bacterium]
MMEDVARPALADIGRIEASADRSAAHRVLEQQLNGYDGGGFEVNGP